MAQLAAIPDGPDFEPTLSEQVDEVLQGINVTKKPSSAAKLYEWVAKHPGPQAAATAALALRVATKVPLTTAERRISLLYATHELFKRASKEPDMDFDYAAWQDAVKALVPWTIRKQSEADRMKINKSVLKSWVGFGWFKRDFVEALASGKATPSKKASAAPSRAPSSSSPAPSSAAEPGSGRRRRGQGGSGSGRGGGGGGAGSNGSGAVAGGVKRQRTASSPSAMSPATAAGAENGSGNGKVAKKGRTDGGKAGNGGGGSGGSGGVVAGPWVEQDSESSAFHPVDLAGAGYSPIRGGDGGDVLGPGDAELAAPSEAELAEAVAEMAALARAV
ncbi:unnamed protein product, partial [Scytosiphon promiscuus]